MRISTRGRYSLEALLCMALFDRAESCSIRDIAEETGISDGYLEQLFIPLRKAGIVKGIRGPQGGYVLDSPLKRVTVGDILRIAEGALEPVSCVKSETCPIQEECDSRAAWVELYQEINSWVDSLTLADLVEKYHHMDRIEYTI